MRFSLTVDFHDPKLWTCKLHFQECNRSSWRRWEEHENTLSNSSPVVVLCFLNRHVSKLLNLVLHISKKRVSRRGKHSRKSRLLMATELCQNVKVCLQSTPNFVLFRLFGRTWSRAWILHSNALLVSYGELCWATQQRTCLIGWEQLENPGILLANPKSHSKRVKPRDWKSVISLELSSLSLQRRWNTAKI